MLLAGLWAANLMKSGRLAMLDQGGMDSHPNATLNITIVTFPVRVGCMILWICIGCALTRLKERIGRSAVDRFLGIVANDFVARSVLGTGAAGAEEGDVTASHGNTTAGASDRNAVAVHVRDVDARAIALRRAE